MLNIAIVGSNFGVIGLLPAFSGIKDCKVVAICAKESEQLRAYSKRTGFKNIYSDWQSLLKNEEIDAIALAVTPNAQYKIAKVAIKNGIHVFAEKPLTATVEEARDLLKLARKKKITHCVDFTFPEIAEWQKVKELIDQKTYGKLKHISVHWDWLAGDIKYKRSSWKTNVREGGGVLSFYFSHGLYYLEHFAGQIMNIESLFTYSKESLNGGEVAVDLLMQFENGITGDAHVSASTRGLIRHHLSFQCERGMIVLENHNAIVSGFTIKVFTENGEKNVPVGTERNKKGEDERVKEVRKIAKRFITACKARKQTYPSFEAGVRVQELIELARRSNSF